MRQNPKLWAHAKHIAFIMDGNRRYARKSSIDRQEGHLQGFNKLAETLQWCLDLGITEVTVYAFSIENFKRSKDEVDGLMHLARQKFEKLLEEKNEIMKHGVCIRVLGDLTLLPKDVQEVVADAMYISRNNTRAILNVCMAYTARHEITNAFKEVSWGVSKGLLKPSDISEEVLEKCFYTSHSPDPDLLIRTSGEVRLSDFLLWQHYSVLAFVEVLWPEYSIWHFFQGILYYQMNQKQVQLARDKRDALRLEAILESDKTEVVKMLSEENKCPEETAILPQRIAEYAAQRQKRITNFVETLDAKRTQQLLNMLPARTMSEIPTS
ncbi:putative dehydrodolichyl diphosphate syntase complex subunit DHDDS [Apostichopus japonicus]|uniref:Alkyl transferase n=1 Tax=Stichopus japonicus TaxID=307972 RepID=A0A2G8KS71_STIJA|nr:putative dehydrodolichyl diphosphate syntase complex subunit DHDDS [Apostichopus japonicus]